MDAGGESGYLARLAARVRPSGAFTTLEEPKTLVWIAVAWTWGAAVNSAWIAAIFFVFDEPAVGWVSTVLALVFVGCWFLFAATGSVRATFGIAVSGSIAAVTFTHVVMGGYANSGSFLFWGIGVTVVAVLALTRGEAAAVGAYWLTAAALFGFLEQTLKASRPAPNPTLPAVIGPYTMILITVLLVPVMAYLLGRLSAERSRAEALLLNVLPESIARRLKTESTIIAEDFTECSVLFADISGFTAYTRAVSPHQLVERLNAIFSTFDDLVARHGVQKIKTIGDGYMAVAGVPDPRDDHVEVVCRLALDMQEAVAELTKELQSDLQVRIGVSTGPVVAGIIGTSRFSYDLWGDTVNLASRMESHGEAGQIQVTASVRELGRDLFDFQSVGRIDVKGMGSIETYLLKGPLPSSVTS